MTSASIRDSQVIEKLVDETDKIIYADVGYVGTEKFMPKNVEKKICSKGYRNKKLTKDERRENKVKSKIRCRIEHIFGTMRTSMNNVLNIRSIGQRRAEFSIELTNIIYNMIRLKFLVSIG